MEKLGMVDLQVVELLWQAPEIGLSAFGIAECIDQKLSTVRKSIEKLMQRKLVEQNDFLNFSYFSIQEGHRSMFHQVKCPKCGTVKRVYHGQKIALCINRECVTKSGERTAYWITPRKIKEMENK
jgi:Fe2+ or Zn2+ uptake regulation protein